MMSRAKTLAMIVFIALLGVTSLPSTAHAARGAKANPAAIQESNGRWKISFEIDLGKVPDIQFVTLSFSFELVMAYRRELTEASPDKPVLRKEDLKGQTPVISSEQVTFSNGTKVFPNTKYQFVVKRENGFIAGEYMVTIKTDDGSTVGKAFRITLNGENEVEDRRPLAFHDSGAKPKKEPEKTASTDTSGEPKSDGTSSTDSSSSSSSTSSEGSSTEGSDPPNNAPKKGGCACELASAAEGDRWGEPGWLVALGAFALVLGRRRRRFVS